ncbi:MAG: TonB-dependent receptor [Pseudomonadales bacterium]
MNSNIAFPGRGPASRIVALLTLCASTGVPAADTGPLSFSESRWEELVVVGSLLPRPAREVGSAVTVLGAHDIEIRQVNLGADLLRVVPGLSVNRSGPEGNVTQVRVRGAEGNHTLVLIDGIEANDPGISSEFNFADLLTYDVGRIEVLRGPQSALYGSDALGGVIRIESTTPASGLHAHGEVEGGSFGTRQLGASVGGAGARVSGLLSASRYTTDGISASAIDPEKDGFDTTTVHARLGVEPTPWLDARLVLRQTDSDVDNDRQDFDFPPTATEGLIVDANSSTEARRRYGLLEVNAELLDGAWLQRAAVGYTDTRSDGYTDAVRSNGTRGERRKFEYQSTLRLDRGTLSHAITAAVQRELLDFENLSAAFPGANQKQNDAQTSVIGEYALGLGAAASLSLSLRHDRNDRFDDATTVRATGSYLFERSGTRLHASFGEGITNPTFTELFGFDPGSFVGNPDLAPERSRSVDLGVEQALLDGRALVDVTLFKADLEDEIVTLFDFTTFVATAANQRGRSDRRGAELTARARLTGAWSVYASYTYLDASDPDGRREVRRPSHSGSVNLHYALGDGRGNVNLGAVFNGRQQDSEFISATPASRVTLGAYTLLNLAASYDVSDTLQVFVRGENLLDENYTEVFGYRSPGIAGYLGVRFQLTR